MIRDWRAIGVKLFLFNYSRNSAFVTNFIISMLKRDINDLFEERKTSLHYIIEEKMDKFYGTKLFL